VCVCVCVRACVCVCVCVCVSLYSCAHLSHNSSNSSQIPHCVDEPTRPVGAAKHELEGPEAISRSYLGGQVLHHDDGPNGEFKGVVACCVFEKKHSFIAIVDHRKSIVHGSGDICR
jgi:hypothetical protein